MAPAPKTTYSPYVTVVVTVASAVGPVGTGHTGFRDAAHQRDGCIASFLEYDSWESGERNWQVNTMVLVNGAVAVPNTMFGRWRSMGWLGKTQKFSVVVSGSVNMVGLRNIINTNDPF